MSTLPDHNGAGISVLLRPLRPEIKLGQLFECEGHHKIAQIAFHKDYFQRVGLTCNPFSTKYVLASQDHNNTDATTTSYFPSRK